MKKSFTLLILFAFFVLHTSSQESYVLKVKQKFDKSLNTSPVYKPMKDKESRLKSTKGSHIKAVYDKAEMESIHPLAPIIIEDAVKLWEEKMNFKSDMQVEINFFFDELINPDIAYEVDLIYTNYNNTLYPSFLSQYLFGHTIGNQDFNSVYLNSNTSDWHFDGDTDSQMQQGKYDFKMAVLRSIAQVFGFTSSVTASEPEFIWNNKRTIYESKVINTNTVTLSQVNDNSSDIKTFATGNNVFWKTSNTGYKIYAPANYVPDISLNYFDSESELMSYAFSSQNIVYDIDDKVLAVLEDIGWDTSKKDLTIYSDGIGSSGVASIYNSYVFQAQSSSPISNYNWEYKVYLKGGGFKTIKKGTSTSFGIESIVAEPRFDVNASGDIKAEITLSASVNGKNETSSFNLYLESAPSDIDFNLTINKVNDWHFEAIITATSYGADKFNFTISDYGMGSIENKFYNDKQYLKYAYILYYGYPTEFEIVTSNKYGSKYFSYYLDEVYYDSSRAATGIHQNTNNDSISSIHLYNMNGALISILHNMDELKSLNLQSGAYLVKSIYKSGRIETHKLLK